MESTNLVINDGRKKFTVNGDENRAFYVNLADNMILVRAKKAMNFFKSLKQEDYMKEGMDEIDAIEKINEDCRKQIDYVFDYGVSEAVFGNISPMATVDQKTGKIYSEAFLEAIMPQIEKAQKAMEKSMKESDKRIQKYTAKYTKK